MSNLVNHARTEFKAAGWLNEDGSFKDEMQQLICEQILELLELFSSHGHTGSSAPYALNMFNTLAKFEPIVPLTGEDWEWNECSDGVFQNKRCSHVFKQTGRFNGQAYDIQGRVFYENAERALEEGEEGYPGVSRFKSYYTCGDSFVPVVFPYTPTIEYIERASNAG